MTIWSLVRQLHDVEIFVLAFVILTAAVWLFDKLPGLRRRLVLNVIIEIPESQETVEWLSFPITIINRSRTRPISLHFTVVQEAMEPPPERSHTRSVDHTLQTGLGPQQETSGQIRVSYRHWPPTACVFRKHQNSLIVGDRISQRRVEVTIPGQFRP